jgi:predicted NUDIX family NTP pyrophosphohydrolase
MPKVNFTALLDQNLLKKSEPAVHSQRNYKAEKAFRKLKYQAGDKHVALQTFKKLYPDYTPERFRSSGNMKTRKGYESLRGRANQNRGGNCGDMGRLRVISGQPLWWSRFFFSKLLNTKLHDVERDPMAQFQQQTKDWIKEDLEKVIKGPFIAVVEMGRHGRNHVHVFHLKNACDLGRTKLVPDGELPEKAGYIKKNPQWDDENAIAYLIASEFDGQARNRIIKKDLGNARGRRIIAGDVEVAIGMDLFRGAKKVGANTAFIC